MKLYGLLRLQHGATLGRGLGKMRGLLRRSRGQLPAFRGDDDIACQFGKCADLLGASGAGLRRHHGTGIPVENIDGVEHVIDRAEAGVEPVVVGHAIRLQCRHRRDGRQRRRAFRRRL